MFLTKRLSLASFDYKKVSRETIYRKTFHVKQFVCIKSDSGRYFTDYKVPDGSEILVDGFDVGEYKLFR